VERGPDGVRRNVEIVRLAVVRDAERVAVRMDGQSARHEAGSRERRVAIAAGADDLSAAFERGEAFLGRGPLLAGHPGGAEQVGFADGFAPLRQDSEQPRVQSRGVGPCRRRLVVVCQRYSAKTAAATTDVHKPSRSPMADWVTLRVVTILVDKRQMSLR